MNIIDNPSELQINKMQNLLANESGLGIIDIFVVSNPLYLLALDAGKEVGVISLSVGDTFAEIFKLYVPATSRRKKYASKLFEHAILYLSSKGIKEVAIEAVGDSYSFWNKIITDYKYNFIGDNKVILQISNIK